MRLDHIAIAAQTLAEGVAWAEDKLGVAFTAGGAHPRFATHNRLLGLADGLYLEVIAPDPDEQCVGPRWFDLDRFSGPPRLANWICEPEDFDASLLHGMRAVAMARGDLRWDMGVPEDGSLPLDGAFPTVLRWHTQPRPGETLSPSGCALKSLTISHPQAREIEVQIGAALNDTRVRFQIADVVGLRAEIQTPSGVVIL